MPSLFAFDYDGTLSPIVRNPYQAGVASEVSELMRELCKRAPVAVISGRSVSDLKSRLEFKPKYVVGNHGIEGAGFSPEILAHAASVCRSWRDEVRRLLGGACADPGIEIEDKKYSLAIHYRLCRSQRDVKVCIFNTLSSLTPSPRLVLGKAVVNLLPVGVPHKGAALLKLMAREGARSAFYVGDDDTDEDVFALVDQPIMTVRVGFKRTSCAQYFIKKQPEIRHLLKSLLISLPR